MAFSPIHMSGCAEDFQGNGRLGRFVMIPGSRARAAKIAERLEGVRIKTHPRGHDLHLGVLEHGGHRLDMAVISTGMGCPSIDLLVTELLALGARVLLRIGTSGSLQSNIHTGDLVVATAAVRDEAASDDYLPREFPAIASLPIILAAERARRVVALSGELHFGTVHTKDSLYARELGYGPRQEENARYTRMLTHAGVMASEMECAHLFVLGQLGARAEGRQAALVGAVLAVIGEHDQPFCGGPAVAQAEEDAILFAFETLGQLRSSE